MSNKCTWDMTIAVFILAGIPVLTLFHFTLPAVLLHTDAHHSPSIIYRCHTFNKTRRPSLPSPPPPKMTESRLLRQQQHQQPQRSTSNLLKRFVNRFNIKFSHFISLLYTHRKSVASFGALVGFVLSVFFTWKFLRPRKVIKGNSDSSSSTRNHGLVAAASADDFVISSSSKLSLQEIVRKKLNGGRKMTCRLLGVILEENSPDELQDHVTIRESAVEMLLEISRYCDIYLMERTLDDESGEKVISALENANLFRNGSSMKDKVLFCSTDNGILSFLRQLEPDWHLDTNPDVLSQLTKFVRYQLYISATGSGIASGSNIFTSPSIKSYFSDENVS